jgi:hypothetical protein
LPDLPDTSGHLGLFQGRRLAARKRLQYVFVSACDPGSVLIAVVGF